MNTSTNSIAVSTVIVEQRSAKGFAGLMCSFRELVSEAISETKDQSYADYLETMSVLTGF